MSTDETITQSPKPNYPDGMNDSNAFWKLNYKQDVPFCRALVLSAGDGKHCRVLDFIGPDFDYLNEIDSGQFHHEEFNHLPVGIWIVEGSLHSSGPDHNGEYADWLESSHRPLTIDEWQDYTLNDCPWDPKDWGTAWVTREDKPEPPETVPDTRVAEYMVALRDTRRESEHRLSQLQLGHAELSQLERSWRKSGNPDFADELEKLRRTWLKAAT